MLRNLKPQHLVVAGVIAVVAAVVPHDGGASDNIGHSPSTTVGYDQFEAQYLNYVDTPAPSSYDRFMSSYLTYTQAPAPASPGVPLPLN